MELNTLKRRAPIVRSIFLLLVAIILIADTFLMGETLFFGVSPFDTSFRLVGRYDFSFWKFVATFSASIKVEQKVGFVRLIPDFSDVFEYFEFRNEPYKVTYSNLNNDIPFTTFANPAKKSWNATWVNTGYFADGYIHKNDYFSILSDKTNINVTFRVYGMDIFFENSQDGFTIGAGNKVYLFAGDKTGVGLLLNDENFLIYALAFYKDGNFLTKSGFTLKTDNFEINVLNDVIDGSNVLTGKVILKVGEMYVIGRLQGQEVRLDFEFPIW